MSTAPTHRHPPDEAEIIALETTRDEILEQIKEVEHRLSGTKRKSPSRGDLIERKELLIRSLREQKLRIRRARNISVQRESPVSDHAVLRWLERKHGIDVDRIREIMLCEPLKEAIGAGHESWSDGEFVFVLQDGNVTTVMPSGWRLRGDRKSGIDAIPGEAAAIAETAP